MSKICMYALGGINYKNGVITTCPRQANQLVYANETIMPSDIFNHQNFRMIREKLYNGEWPSGCDTCEEMEKVGSQSMRLDYVLNNENKFVIGYRHNVLEKSKPSVMEYATEVETDSSKLIDCYDINTHYVKNEGLRHVELRFSTACNFACLHCSEVYSSGWTKKLKNFIPDEETKLNNLRQLLGTEHRHGPNDKNEMSLTTKQSLMIAEDLNENFPYISFIDFAGGEVLYQKQFFPTLRKLSEHPNAKNMRISFHTNFNADFDIIELSDILSKFGNISILISVDAGKSFYSYFRHGGQWDKLESNIKQFKEYNKNELNYDMDISVTTSIYQMLDLPDVFESFYSLDCNFDASIVQTPKYINPCLIMNEYKNQTLYDIDLTYKLVEKYDKDNLKLSKFWLNYIVDYVTKTKLSYNYYNKFLIYRKKSDEIWNQNFNEYFRNYQIIDDELVRIK